MNQAQRLRTTELSPVMVHVHCWSESEYLAHPVVVIRLPISAKMDLMPPGIGHFARGYLASDRYREFETREMSWQPESMAAESSGPETRLSVCSACWNSDV